MEYSEYIEDEEVAHPAGAAETAKVAVERVLIDSLPYIDSYDDAAQAAAMEMVYQEMKTFKTSHTVEPVTVSFTV
jgi:hypothetical protein